MEIVFIIFGLSILILVGTMILFSWAAKPDKNSKEKNIPIVQKDELGKNSLFEGAKLGDIFLIKNGRKAIYFSHTINAHILIIEDIAAFFKYYDNGKIYEHCLSELARMQGDINIVSKYTEPIDEDKLDNLAYNKYLNVQQPTQEDYNLANAFKAGYRKAKEK